MTVTQLSELRKHYSLRNSESCVTVTLPLLIERIQKKELIELKNQ